MSFCFLPVFAAIPPTRLLVLILGQLLLLPPHRRRRLHGRPNQKENPVGDPP